MNVLQQTVDLNNEGIRLFQSGNLVEGLHCIQQGITTLKGTILGPNDAPETGFSSAFQTSVRQSHHFPVEGSSFPLVAKETDILHPYFRLIPFDIQRSADNCIETLTDGLFSSVMFNLAVACHCVGTRSGSSVLMERARELYFVVLKSQHRILTLFGGCETTMRQGALIQCLALNNLAHLTFETCDYENSQLFLEYMLDIHENTGCLFFSPEHCHNNNDSTSVAATTTIALSEWEMDEIRLNILYANPPPVASSA